MPLPVCPDGAQLLLGAVEFCQETAAFPADNRQFFGLQQRFMEQQLMLLDKFLSAETIWLLTCRNDDDAARVSYEAMKR